MKRAVWAVLSLALVAGLVLVSDPAKVASAIADAETPLILLGVGVWLFELGVRVVRWRYLLQRTGIPSGYAHAARAYAAGLFLANLTPGRSGDPIRSVLLKRENATPLTHSIPSVVVERILDTLVLLVLAGLGLVLFGARVPSLTPWALATMAGYIAVVVASIYVMTSPRRTTLAVSWVVRGLAFLPFVRRRASRAIQAAANLTHHFRRFSDWETILVALAGSAVIWILEGVIVVLGFRSLGLPVDPVLAVAATAFVILVSAPATLPGGLGSPEVVMALVFFGVFGFGASLTTAAVLVSRFMSFGVAALVGGAVLLFGFPKPRPNGA